MPKEPTFKAEIQQIPTYKFDTSKKVYEWTLPGAPKGKNNFPAKAIELVGRSGLASRALEVVGKYLMGDGLKLVMDGQNELLERIVKKINDRYLGEVCDSFAYFPSIALNTLHNGNGEIIDIQVLDNSTVRIGLMGEDMKEKYYVTCGDWPQAKDAFDPNYPQRFMRRYSRYEGKEKASVELLAFKSENKDHPGQLYFEQMKRPGDFMYALPVWWGGSNAIYLDGEILIFQVDQLDNNFNATVVLYTTEDLSGRAPEGSGHATMLEYIKGEVKKKFVKRSDKGGDGDRFIVVDKLQADKGVKPLEVVVIPNGASHDMFLATYDKAHQSVLEAIGVPNALITGGDVGGIGNAEVVINEVVKFNDSLLKAQKFIAYHFERIIKDWAGIAEEVEFSLEIVQNNPFYKLPSEVLDALTPEERLREFGLQYILDKRAEDAKLQQP